MGKNNITRNETIQEKGMAALHPAFISLQTNTPGQWLTMAQIKPGDCDTVKITDNISEQIFN